MAKGSEQTLKAQGWQPQAQPDEDSDILFHRQFINQIVFSIHHTKKEILAKMCMPAQPVTLEEIYREYQSRVAQLKQMRLWKHKTHSKRWLDRRVNECATPKFYDDRIPKLVAVTAGHYAPNLDPNAGELVKVERTGTS